MGDIVEVKSFIRQFIFVQVYFTLGWNKVHKNPPVFAQYIVDVPNVIRGFAVQPVVIIVAAHIRTEFFIYSSSDGFSAVEANFFHITGIYYSF
jgi:hypothetical protein